MTGHLTVSNFLCAHNRIISLHHSRLRLGKVAVTLWVDIRRRLLSNKTEFAANEVAAINSSAVHGHTATSCRGALLGPDNVTAPNGHVRRWLWRMVLVLIVALPFLPPLSIYAVVALAKIKGCNIADVEICLAGPLAVSRTIVGAPGVGSDRGAGFIVSVALAWLAVCYIAARFGWDRIWNRLLVGLAVTLVFSLLPYFAALPAFGNFVVPECRPHEGGFGVCGLFDGNVGSSGHILLLQIWLSFVGLPLGFLAFLFYLAAILGPSFASPNKG